MIYFYYLLQLFFLYLVYQTFVNYRIEKIENDLKDAIEYLFVEDFVGEMTTDKAFYTNVLLNQVANDLNIKLKRD